MTPLPGRILTALEPRRSAGWLAYGAPGSETRGRDRNKRSRKFAAFLTIFFLLSAASYPQGAASYRISGMVVDGSTGAPLDGVQVAIQPAADRRGIQTSRTGLDGRFSFAALPAGRYVLGAQRRDYPLQSLDQHGEFSTAVATGPGLDSVHVVFRLQPGASLSGTVTEEHNEAVRGATVFLLRSQVIEGVEMLRNLAGAQTDDRGIYKFDRLRAGKYFVVVSARPWWIGQLYGLRRGTSLDSAAAREFAALNLAYPLTYYPAATDFGDAEPIPLRPGDEATADVQLSAVPALNIKQPIERSATAGLPAGAAGVSFGMSLQALLPNGQRIPVNAATSSDGRQQSITGLAPGRYVLTMHHSNPPGAGAPPRDQTSQRFVDVSGDLDLGSEDSDAGQLIRGTVHFLGKPEANTLFMLRDVHTLIGAVAPVQPSGEFEMPEALLPGTYEVAINPPSGYVSQWSATGAKIDGHHIEVAGAAPINLDVTVSFQTGEVDGIATKHGKPIAGAMIVLLPDPGNTLAPVLRDQSNSDGSFSLTYVIPGKYTLLAIENGWELQWRNPAVLRPFLAHGRPLTIEPRKYNATVEVQKASAQ